MPSLTDQAVFHRDSTEYTPQAHAPLPVLHPAHQRSNLAFVDSRIYLTSIWQTPFRYIGTPCASSLSRTRSSQFCLASWYLSVSSYTPIFAPGDASPRVPLSFSLDWRKSCTLESTVRMSALRVSAISFGSSLGDLQSEGQYRVSHALTHWHPPSTASLTSSSDFDRSS